MKALKCRDNEEYAIKSDCPATCIFPDGDYDCGEMKPTEGCFCKKGFVYDALGRCINKNLCGCETPDGILPVNFFIFLIRRIKFLK